MFALNMPLLLFRVVFATLDDGGLENTWIKDRPEQAAVPGIRVIQEMTASQYRQGIRQRYGRPWYGSALFTYGRTTEQSKKR